jgi:hypothetical protein
VAVTAPVATFEKAPKLSAAAQAAYVPKNARPADVKVLPTADMFPALPSKNSAAKTEVAVKSENKKPTFADIMKKRVEQDAIDAEIAERERLREQERKEREERDNRYIQIGTRGNSAAVAHYEEEEDVDQGYDGMYEENAFARPTGGYNPSDYGYHAEEEMAPPVEKEGAIKWAIRLLMDKEARMDYARETFKKHDVDGSGGMDVDEMCGLITVCTHAHVVADDGAL